MGINKLLIIASVIIISIAFYECKHEVPQIVIQNPPGTPPSGIVTTTVSCGGDSSFLLCFQSEVLPIFINNCTKGSNCHDAGSHADGYVLDSYDNLFKKDGNYTNNNIRPYKPGNSDLYTVLFQTGNKKMPPASDLSAEQKNLIAQWINQGAFNTTCTPASCDSNQFKFSANILPLLRTNCTGCHSGNNPPSGVDLTTYTNVKALTTNGLNSLLYGVVAHLQGYNAMPKCPDPANPNTSRKLPDCEIAQIRKWIQAGVPNN